MYIGTMNEIGSKNVRVDAVQVGIQVIFEIGRRQCIRQPDQTYRQCHFPPDKMKTLLTDFEVVSAEVNCRFEEFIRRQVQVTIEQLLHRDEGSKRNASLHGSQIEFLEAC